MTKKSQKRRNQRLNSIGLIFLIDITLTAISFIASYKICTTIWPELSEQRILIQLPVIIAITSLIFLLIGHSKGVVKYSRTKEVYSIFNAICLANILTIVLVVVHSKVVTNNENSFLIPVSIIIVHSLLSFISLLLSRFLFKAFHDSLKDEPVQLARILLSGQIKDAKKIISAFEQSSLTAGEYDIVGFVNLDEKPTDLTSLGSVWIVDKDKLNNQLIREHNITEYVITKSGNFDEKTSRFLTKVSTLPVKIRVAQLPHNQIDTEEGASEIKAINNLKLTDLFTPNSQDFEKPKEDVSSYFAGKKILVIGAAGCVGRALVKKLAGYKSKSILLLDKAEDSLFGFEQELAIQKVVNTKTLLGDILDKNRLENVFKEFSPDIVLNAAGYKIFDFTKDNLYEALRLNILGNKLVADMAVKHGVQKYINLSRSFPIKYCTYTRATERVGEIYLNCLNAESKTEFVNIRFGNVLESKSSVMNVFKSQLDNGGPIKISSKEATISFISVEELSHLIIEAIFHGKGGDIFKVKMGDPIKEFDLAKQIRTLSHSHVANHIDIIEAKNLNEAEPLCELASSKISAVEFKLNKKLQYIREDEFDTQRMKNKINTLCIANMFFDENITDLMDQILQYDTSSSDKNFAADSASHANVLERKINPLAV